MDTEIKGLRQALIEAKSVAVLTGAGISAESGVPTFRGAGGLWRKYRSQELATPEAFATNPELVWEFYNWRRTLIKDVEYNPAHRALVDLEAKVPHFTLISQNVDGLHLRAGTKNLLEIHGNIWKVRCTECGKITVDFTPDLGTSPRCDECSGLLRPHVVWFGENLDYDILQRAFDASTTCDVMLVIGTSAVVQPSASFPFEAKAKGALVAEINIESTPLSDLADITLLGKAGEIIPRLVENWP